MKEEDQSNIANPQFRFVPFKKGVGHNSGSICVQDFLVIRNLPVRSWLAWQFLCDLADLNRACRIFDEYFHQMNWLTGFDWIHTHDFHAGFHRGLSVLAEPRAATGRHYFRPINVS